jgi:hypothetical protein
MKLFVMAVVATGLAWGQAKYEICLRYTGSGGVAKEVCASIPLATLKMAKDFVDAQNAEAMASGAKPKYRGVAHLIYIHLETLWASLADSSYAPSAVLQAKQQADEAQAALAEAKQAVKPVIPATEPQ